MLASNMPCVGRKANVDCAYSDLYISVFTTNINAFGIDWEII